MLLHPKLLPLLSRRNLALAGALLLVGVGSVGVWLSPLRQPAVQQLKRVAGIASSPPEDTYLTPTPEPTTDVLADLRQQVREVQAGLDALEVARRGDQQVIDSLRNDYQLAVKEVAQTNDLLEKQLSELKKTLASVRTGAPPAHGTDPAPSATASASPSVSTSGKLNLNVATLSQLDGLPGIGPSYAQRIIDYRTEHGPFKTVDDLDKVAGIGPSTIAKLRDLVEV